MAFLVPKNYQIPDYPLYKIIVEKYDTNVFIFKMFLKMRLFSVISKQCDTLFYVVGENGF